MRSLTAIVLSGIAFAVLGSPAASGQSAPPPEVWISPNDPTHGGAADFWDMLAPNASWPSAKARVRVFAIAQNLVTNGPPDKLRQFFAGLKANDIKLAISIGMLTWSDQCGKHVEGYVPPGGSKYVADRIKALGGEPAYIDIDEALWFGRYYAGAGACHSSIDQLARDVAANFRAYQADFPNVQLGDTEPLGPPPGGDRPGSNWATTTQAWIDTLQQATGAHLAFIHEDVTNWKRPLAEYLPAVSNLARANHMAFGAIFIAGSGDGPNSAWMQSAERNIDAVRALAMAPQDHLCFATWHRFPTQNLPETSSDAFTHLIDYYFRKN